MNALKNKLALVTGAGRGIGRACARLLASRGCRVVLVSRTRHALESVAEEIRLEGGESSVYSIDIAEESAVKSLFAKVGEHWGRVDILVNNAAIFVGAPVPEHGVREWDEVMAVNVRGVFLCAREVFRQSLMQPRTAAIVNIASLAGVRGTEKFPGFSSYTASKFAVVGLTESLAVEGRSLGIRVNCVAPGAVDTEMLRKAAPHLKTQTTPAQIAKTVLYLADDSQSGHLNGTLIEVFSNVLLTPR